MLIYWVYPTVKSEMMLIGELAKKCDVTKDTIRHYDKLDLLIAIDKAAGSRTYRDFCEKNIERIEMIKSAKMMGFTLKKLQEYTASFDNGKMSDNAIIELLNQNLEVVRGKIMELRHTEKILVEKLRRYE